MDSHVYKRMHNSIRKFFLGWIIHKEAYLAVKKFALENNYSHQKISWKLNYVCAFVTPSIMELAFFNRALSLM